MTDDKATIEVFQEWRLDINIKNLISTFRNGSVFNLKCEGMIDKYFLSEATKNNTNIVLLFQGKDKSKGIFQLRHTVKDINEGILFLNQHISKEVQKNEK